MNVSPHHVYFLLHFVVQVRMCCMCVVLDDVVIVILPCQSVFGSNCFIKRHMNRIFNMLLPRLYINQIQFQTKPTHIPQKLKMLVSNTKHTHKRATWGYFHMKEQQTWHHTAHKAHTFTFTYQIIFCTDIHNNSFISFYKFLCSFW